MKKTYYLFNCLFIMCSFIILGSFIGYVYAQSITTIDNVDRREYTYCPLSDSDVKAFNGEINGCPLMRVYVDDWSKKTLLEQSTIDNMLRAKGFVDSGEHVLK